MSSTTLAAAQADLRLAHVNGGTGVIASGCAWLLAGLVWAFADHRTGFIALFLAGMAIAPLAALLSRKVFKAPPSSLGKRLEWVAIATLPVMLAGFYLGWLRMDSAPDAAIPLVACSVGVRYLVFPVMYGRAVFAALGLAFIALGLFGMARGDLPVGNIALVLGLLELGVGSALCARWKTGAAATR